jgi:hypothetical protein
MRNYFYPIHSTVVAWTEALAGHIYHRLIFYSLCVRVDISPVFIGNSGYCKVKVKIKVSRYMSEQALGVSGRLRLRIFMTFDTMNVVGRQSYAPVVFTPKSFLVLIFRG